MDAQVAYGFHQLREKKPKFAKGPITNKVWFLFSHISLLDIDVKIPYRS